jgi:hypothetical protein
VIPSISVQHSRATAIERASSERWRKLSVAVVSSPSACRLRYATAKRMNRNCVRSSRHSTAHTSVTHILSQAHIQVLSSCADAIRRSTSKCDRTPPRHHGNSVTTLERHMHCTAFPGSSERTDSCSDSHHVHCTASLIRALEKGQLSRFTTRPPVAVCEWALHCSDRRSFQT